MKASLRLTACVAALVALIAAGVGAQGRNGDAQRARGLFVNKKADAMRIYILKSEGDKLVPVDPSQEFTSGDQIKLSFESNFEGYVYVVNVTPGGKKCVLFPYSAQGDNTVRPGRRYDLPPNNDMIEFDDETGTEVLQVVMSRERVASLDEALKEPGSCLGDTASSAAAQLAVASGVVGDKVTPAFASGGIRARSIILAPGKDRDQEGTVVAISDKSGGKLKGKDAAVFEVRLKHN